MCDCVYPSSRFQPREFSGGRFRGGRLSRFFAAAAECRDVVVQVRRSLPRQRTIVADYGNSFSRVGHYSAYGNRRQRAFSSDAHGFLRRVNSARLKDDGGVADGADLRPASFPEATSASGPSNSDILQLKRELEEEEIAGEHAYNAADEKNLVTSESAPEKRDDSILHSRRSRQLIRRSSLLAKQVISINSARSLGFISQLWVDTISWTVVVVEVRPHLLSGEIERLLLEDLHQVGDVVLVQDESVLENELKMNGLDTLVGYNVVTSTRRKIGKVRGYNFNINSGAVESLELDSMGMSLIPASLVWVSTYSLMVEDVIRVVADTVMVDQESESRLQRLTKGLLDNRGAEAPGSWEDSEEFSELGRRANRSTRRRRSPVEDRVEDYWDLPVDF